MKNGFSISKIIEKKINNSEEKTENQIEITFKTLTNNVPAYATVTLVGDGSIKSLLRV